MITNERSLIEKAKKYANNIKFSDTLITLEKIRNIYYNES